MFSREIYFEFNELAQKVFSKAQIMQYRNTFLLRLLVQWHAELAETITTL